MKALLRFLRPYTASDVTVMREQLKVVSDSIGKSAIAPLLLFSFLAWFEFASSRFYFILGVGVAYVGTVVWNHRQIAIAVRGDSDESELLVAYRRYFVAFCVLSLLIATVPWLLSENAPTVVAVGLSMLLVVYATGLGFIHAAFPPAVFAFTTALAVSLVAHWYIVMPTWIAPVVVLAICFWLLGCRSTVVFSKLLRGALEQRIAKEKTAALAEKNAQDLVIALQKLRDANDEKTRIFAAANHDLRQPLSAASVLVGILARRALKLETIEQQSSIGEIAEKLDRSIDSLSALLESLSDLSKFESGAIKVQIHPLSLRNFLEVLIEDYSPLVELKGVRIRFETSTELLLTDQALLGRMLRNLIQNALAHAPGSSIEIVEKIVGQKHFLNVIDHGAGITAALRENVFKEYFQLENPERSSIKGYGLGLAIVQRLSKLLDIPVGLSDSSGGGLTVSLDISSSVQRLSIPKPIKAPYQSSSPELSTHEKSVLVVDDELEVRQNLSLLLREFGCKVKQTGLFLEAITFAENENFDLVLVDNWLADGLGIDLCERIKSKGFSGKCVLVTGDTRSETRAAAEAKGIPLLSKPVRAAAMIELLNSI
jgi:signal transduction histidine kinase/CheY-like chemotaxis protein